MAALVVRFALVPGGLYLLAFLILTYPAIHLFSSHFYAGKGDGVMNVWNIWWVGQALASGQSPFYTRYLFHPDGTSLVGHDLGLSNDLIGIALFRFLTPVQTYNALLIASFVSAGLTAFWLCHRVSGSYAASLVGGYLFTFSSYHFAHAEGHLSLVAIQWIPLFLLLWLDLLDDPGIAVGVGAAIVLFVVLLTNNYYFLYCLIAAAVFVAGQAWRRRDPAFLLRPAHRGAALAFAAVAAATSVPLVLMLLQSSAQDPLTGTHDRRALSLDPVALLIPGGHWRFSSLTRGFWGQTGGIHETSVHIGISVAALLGWLWWNRRRAFGRDLAPWFLTAGVFLVLSLGPVLHFRGHEFHLLLPHAWLEAVVPPLRLTNAPVRMVVMCVLAAAVLTACGLDLLWRSGRRGRRLAAAFVLALAFEYLPRPLPATLAAVPAYVRVLQLVPGHDAVLDAWKTGNPSRKEGTAMYHQTVHGKPLFDGRISRIPASVAARKAEAKLVVEQEGREALWPRYGVRYAVMPRRRPFGAAAILFEDTAERVIVYDLAAKAGSPDERPVEPASLSGRLERATCAAVTGWAFDRARPRLPVRIDLTLDDQPLAALSAGLYRPDLAALDGAGGHAFLHPLPPSAKDGRPHTIGARFSATGTALPGTPLIVSCGRS